MRVIAVGGAKRDARAAAERLGADVGVLGVAAPAGDPARTLLGQAARGVDALVVGHRERPAGRAGVSVRVMGGAGCPVWVVPPGAAAVLLRRRDAAAVA